MEDSGTICCHSLHDDTIAFLKICLPVIYIQETSVFQTCLVPTGWAWKPTEHVYIFMRKGCVILIPQAHVYLFIFLENFNITETSQQKAKAQTWRKAWYYVLCRMSSLCYLKMALHFVMQGHFLAGWWNTISYPQRFNFKMPFASLWLERNPPWLCLAIIPAKEEPRDTSCVLMIVFQRRLQMLTVQALGPASMQLLGPCRGFSILGSYDSWILFLGSGDQYSLQKILELWSPIGPLPSLTPPHQPQGWTWHVSMLWEASSTDQPAVKGTGSNFVM